VIEYLSGELVRKAPGEAVVECGGVAYVASISLKGFEALPAGGRVRLLVHCHESESGTRLFGFAADAERRMFRTLLNVRGVGPALALTLLSHETPETLATRIKSGDVKGLTRIKGIGTKTAERLVLELRDRLDHVAGSPLAPEHEQLLVQALQSLGLADHEAAQRARAVVQAAAGETRLEVLLRLALKPVSSSRPA
jgi:Holliday junction DNA helicase RuvA